MNFRLVNREPFAVFGVEEIFSVENGQNLREIPQMWNRLLNDGTVDRIAKASGRVRSESGRGILSVNAVMCYREEEGGRFPYMICGFLPESGRVDEESFTVVEIPAMTWAVFTTEEYTQHETTAKVQSLWKRIFSEWLPTAAYEMVSGAQFEMYGQAESGNGFCEVWIPVRSK
jgi:AraC family transcriptional regulator